MSTETTNVQPTAAKAEKKAKQVKISLRLVSYEPGAPTAQVQEVNLSASRPTVEIGQALNKLLKWSTKYPKGQVEIYKGRELLGSVVAPRAGSVDAFTKLNMKVINILNTTMLFSVEQVLEGTRVSNPVATKIAGAFGFKGTKVSAVEVENFVKSKTKALNVMAKFAKEDAERKVGIASLPNEVRAWHAGVQEERKLRLIEKRAKAELPAAE